MPGTRYWDGSQWTATAPLPTVLKAKRPVWPWILLAVVVLFFGGCTALVAVVGSAGSDKTTTSTGSSGGAPPSRADTTPGVGQEVRDGKFAFTVTNVRTSTREGTSKPRGEFVIITMTVRNIGNEPQSFFVQNQKLIDSGGKEYAADSSTALSINDDTSMILDMNPGFTITTQVPFDVPPGTTYSTVELHDSAFSGGAKVKLQ